jgi:hypothetical protein
MSETFRGEIIDVIEERSGATWFLLATARRGVRIRPRSGYLMRLGDVRTVEGELVYARRGLVEEPAIPRAWVVPERRIFNARRERSRRLHELRMGRAPLRPATRVAVVTSCKSVALDDVEAVLDATQIEVVPVLTKRFDPGELSVALLRAAELPDVDAILVVRGGGSLADLHVFNDLALADVASLVQRDIPIVTGIGHASDHTLLDDVCHCATTPTAAASRVASRLTS